VDLTSSKSPLKKFLYPKEQSAMLCVTHSMIDFVMQFYMHLTRQYRALKLADGGISNPVKDYPLKRCYYHTTLISRDQCCHSRAPFDAVFDNSCTPWTAWP